MSAPVCENAHVFPSELGWMALAWTEKGLARFTFGHPSAAAAIASLNADDDWTATRSEALPKWVANLAERLASYAAGNTEQFDDVPLDLSHLTAFQRKVVAKCRQISRGKTRSYGELAAAIGAPGAARAVGTVMAKNRFPIIIPCHRVVGAGKSLGGFSAEGGLGLKRRMLALEENATSGNPASTRRPLSTSPAVRAGGRRLPAGGERRRSR
jgi:methylated-DNA-[protein]-cysteine S-methyltransferase